tara:strand:+ start:1825 stop:2748 length:924 start_codon:yes stop_codon:yes gene_type:complete
MKRNKTSMSDSRPLSRRETIGIKRNLKAAEEVPGSAELAPLCISTDGTRAWARKRAEPHSVLFCDLSGDKQWKETKVPLSAGNWGFTRCAAEGAFFAMQRREDGMWCITDGEDANASTYLQFCMDRTEIVKTSIQPLNVDDIPAARAVCCIPDIGIGAVIDDLGFVFIPMFIDKKPEIYYRSKELESTLSVQGPLAFFVDRDKVIGIDLRHGEVKMNVPIFQMDKREMVWNISVSGPLLTLCTFFEISDTASNTKNECETGHPRIMSLVCQSDNMHWVISDMTGVAAVSADGEDGKVAVLTTLVSPA